jgi:glyoxylase-like metal-dependent hydrolase (beta-lactamase superfamily II)
MKLACERVEHGPRNAAQVHAFRYSGGEGSDDASECVALWNTRCVDGRWVPTFPKARYIFGADELTHVRRPGLAAAAPETVPVIEDSVMPIVEAKVVDTVRDGDHLLPGLSFEAIPGHTMGQLAVRLTSEGQSALFPGDVFHQPMQIVRPLWNSRFCENQEVARRTRADLLEAEADSGTIIFPSHFGAPHAGSITRYGSGYRFVPLNPAA